MTSSNASSLVVSLSVSRATSLRQSLAASADQFRPKLSVVSLSRAVRVIECCERSIARNPTRLRAVASLVHRNAVAGL